MEKLLVVSATLLFGFLIALLLGFLFAFITQFAWAYSVAEIFHLPGLTFFQAWMLNVLCGMLFKNSSVSTSK